MMVTLEEKRLIESFFNDKNLSKCFIDLYDSVSDFRKSVRFDYRESILGYGCPGEHLSAYISKNSKGFWIKFKTENERVLFELSEYENIKERALMNEMRFVAGKFKYKLSEKKEEAPKEKQSRKSKEKRNPVLAKLKNRNVARKFTREEFNNLADWEYCSSFNEDGYIYTLPNGNKIECDSRSELSMLDYLVSKKLALEIGGQNLCIPYDTAFRESVNYYPDIVILTKDYHIAIIEIKPVTAMSNHTNIEKYKALKEYCDDHRYEYMMVDPDHDYMTFEDLQKMHIPSEITKRIDDYLVDYYGGTNCLLEKSDIPILYEDFEEEYKKGEFELFLHALVIQRDWYNKFKYGFEVYEKPKRTKH